MGWIKWTMGSLASLYKKKEEKSSLYQYRLICHRKHKGHGEWLVAFFYVRTIPPHTGPVHVHGCGNASAVKHAGLEPKSGSCFNELTLCSCRVNMYDHSVLMCRALLWQTLSLLNNDVVRIFLFCFICPKSNIYSSSSLVSRKPGAGPHCCRAGTKRWCYSLVSMATEEG